MRIPTEVWSQLKEKTLGNTAKFEQIISDWEKIIDTDSIAEVKLVIFEITGIG